MPHAVGWPVTNEGAFAVAVTLDTALCLCNAVDIKNENVPRVDRLWSLLCGLGGLYALVS